MELSTHLTFLACISFIANTDTSTLGIYSRNFFVYLRDLDLFFVTILNCTKISNISIFFLSTSFTQCYSSKDVSGCSKSIL